jgi:hypothetical protein
MAGAISILQSLALVNGVHRESFTTGNLSVVQTGQGAHGTVASVGTSEEDIAFGDVSTRGFAILQNLDDTNYVTWGPVSGGSMVAAGRLKPGETAILRLDPAASYKWQANTAACLVKQLILED